MQRLWNQWMNGTQSDQPQASVFSLKQQLASRAGVNRLRKIGPERAFDGFDFMNDASGGYGVGDKGTRLVVEQITEIQVNHSCREPARHLVRVSDEHPSSSAIYVPPSVLLRRCSDQTGCCTFDSHTCAAAADRRVKLPVLVQRLVGDKRKGVEYLEFVEHTKCHCVMKPLRSLNQCYVNDASVSVEPKYATKYGKRKGARPEKKPKERTCRCTAEFASRSLPGGSCKCDCFDGNRKCKRQKRGATHLSETDNRCIVTGNCEPPDCKHGAYKKTHGRCPRWRGEWHTVRFIV